MKKIILASISPRRREILENLNLEFDISPSSIKENIDENDKPEITAMALAFEKAKFIADKSENTIVIGADTLVYLNEEYLEKPKDRTDAFNILKKLSNNTHKVITAIAMIEAGTLNKIIDYSITEVTMKDLDDEKINRYLDTNEYKDKAGAYGIQGYGGLLVKEIKGSYTNVVGLPIELLEKMLEYFNFNIF